MQKAFALLKALIKEKELAYNAHFGTSVIAHNALSHHIIQSENGRSP